MEQVLPPQTQHGAAFEPPRVRQFTVFLENRVGRLQNLLTALEASEHPIRALFIEESGEASLVRLICADADAARRTLAEKQFSFGELDLIAVQLPKKHSQPLTTICAAILAAEINVHYLYPFVVGPRAAALALYVDDPVLAGQLLIKKGFTLLADSDLR